MRLFLRHALHRAPDPAPIDEPYDDELPLPIPDDEPVPDHNPECRL